MRVFRFVIAMLIGVVALPATAQSCAGFVDVTASDPFCANVEWLKNRAITLGCTDTTHYCPGQPVLRLSMAAFMNRLGVALTPVSLYQEAAPGAVTVNATGSQYCVTTPFAVTGFPRSVAMTGSFGAVSASGVTIRAVTVYSTDGGATWTQTGTNAVRSSAGSNQWAQSSSVGTLALNVGQTYLFGIRVLSDAASVPLTDSRCQVLAQLGNRNGTSSPFDLQ